MATPASPTIPGTKLPQVIYAKDQPQYIPLPCWRSPDGLVVTRWRLTLKERFLAFLKGDVYLSIMTFNQLLQPTRIEISNKGLKEEIEEVNRQLRAKILAKDN